MRSQRTRILFLLSLIIVIGSAVFVTQIVRISKENQQLRSDVAEINHIKYNLLNVEEWSVQLKGIIEKKINEFEITPENQENLQQNVEVILFKLINEFESIMEKKTAGNFSRIKRWVASLAIDIDQLRDSVPSFSSQILNELKDPRTKNTIRSFLEDKLDQYVSSTKSNIDLERLDYLLSRYEVDNRKEANELIQNRLENNLSEIEFRALLVIAAVFLMFLITMFSPVDLSFHQVIVLVIGSLILLLGGILLPMIQLEAKIDLINFKLLGENMKFRNNILYYQSKSITDMVLILIKDGSFRMIMVGFLIFMFSLIFPILKLISTVTYASGNERLQQNRIILFFVLKSSKWSMADVFVVAIFMSYIGFNGIVDNQMQQLAKSAEPVETFTTNGTKLLPGFYLFLSFVISGMGLSWLIDKKWHSN